MTQVLVSRGAESQAHPADHKRELTDLRPDIGQQILSSGSVKPRIWPARQVPTKRASRLIARLRRQRFQVSDTQQMTLGELARAGLKGLDGWVYAGISPLTGTPLLLSKRLACEGDKVSFDGYVSAMQQDQLLVPGTHNSAFCYSAHSLKRFMRGPEKMTVRFTPFDAQSRAITSNEMSDGGARPPASQELFVIMRNSRHRALLHPGTLMTSTVDLAMLTGFSMYHVHHLNPQSSRENTLKIHNGTEKSYLQPVRTLAMVCGRER